MDQFAVARALHVLAVLLWIGGVGFVAQPVIMRGADRRGEARLGAQLPAAGDADQVVGARAQLGLQIVEEFVETSPRVLV